MMTEDEKEKARLFLPDLRRSPTSSSRGPAVEEMTSNESVSSNSISNFKWGATNRRSRTQFRGQGDTEISAPALIGSSDKGISGLSAGTSKEKKGTEETRSAQNTGDLGLISSSSSPVTSAQRPLPSSSVGSNSRESKKRDTALHPLIFKEAGLPDNTLLTYKLKNGEGAGIVCNCCNQEVSPSEFEKHAGMGKRRQPYQNIYTSQGLTLHDVALQLHHLNLNSNGFSNASVSSFSDYPNLTSSGCGKEPSVSGPIVPLKRTLQERVVQTESCYFCGYGHTELGKIDPNMIVFCNQCERPCHVKCYNSRVVKKKVPLEILKDYLCFHFLCCQECQSLRVRLEGMEKCEEIAFLGRIRSNICWRLLSSADASRDVKLYLSQVIDIFKDAFLESTDAHSDISDMVYGTHVVSAAILKVRVEHAAELVLIATRSECRKKGYFRLLLESIETNLRACNVSLLMAPVDPEMAQIWSDKLGFTILSADEKKSMLESHPLVMFKNLVLVQKPLA
uniref:N-acetyltransferase domain-containing protein n=1 Tax=Zea mays TaxID=4577 RepID=A0A804LEK9_MAIZE